jgi:hypothetical protein
MSKLQIPLLVALCSICFAGKVIAQNQPLACQGEAAAGLKWENGRWATKTFNQDKFILVQAGNTLTTDSVAKALIAYPGQVSCRNVNQRTVCSDTSGGSLFFDPRTLTGGISQLLGGTNLGDKRDTVSVQIFSCTPF